MRDEFQPEEIYIHVSQVELAKHELIPLLRMKYVIE